MAAHRAYSRFTVEKADEERRIIEGFATTPKTDRVGDIVEPDGADFVTPLPLLWQHDSLAPIGEVLSATKTARGIRFRARIAAPEPDDPPGLRNRLQEAWASVRKGLTRGVSIGFSAIEYAMMDNGGIHFLKWNWHELSVVTIPANVEATITNIKACARCDAGKLISIGARQPRAAALPFTKAETAADPRKGGIMSIAEKLAALETERSELDEIAKELGVRIADDAANDNDLEEFDRVASKLSELDEAIKRLKSVANLLSGGAAPARRVDGSSSKAASASRGFDAEPRQTRVETSRVKEPKGIAMARAAICTIGAYYENTSPLAIAEKYYRDRDPRVIAYLKAPQPAANTGVAAYAGDFATAQDVRDDFLEFLRGMTLLGKFGRDGVPSLRRMPLNTKINRALTGFIGFEVNEGAATPVSGMTGDQITLSPREFAGGAVVTKRQLRYANISLEEQVRNDIAAGIAQIEDDRFINPAVVGSITNGAPSSASSGDAADNVVADIQTGVDPIENLRMPSDQIVIITRPNIARAAGSIRGDLSDQRVFEGVTMRGGNLEGYPVITSHNVPEGLVVFVHAPSVLYGDDGVIMVEASDTASVLMDTAPAANSATATGGSLTPMFQTRSVYIQGVHEANWALGRAGAVQVLTGVTWNGTSGGSSV